MSLASYAKKNLELIISFVAVAMAIAAVVVAVYETSLMREHARLSVKPSVWLEKNSRIRMKDDVGEFELLIKNKGLGPANLGYFTIQDQGEYLNFWHEFLSHVPLEGDDDKSILEISETVAPQEYALPGGDEISVFSIRAPSDLIRRVIEASDQYKITICACSFYNECWVSHGLNTAPDIINECKIDPKNQFRGVQ